MEYIYSVMLLNSLGKQVDEANIKKVLESAGAVVDEAKIKSVVAALDGVDIANVVREAQTSFAVAPTAQAGAGASTEAKAEVKKEEEKPSVDDAAAGLGSLF